MVRVISQETYDEVVKENIEEFDMTPQDAIKEAVAQFEAQGVDLSNIMKDLVLGAGDDHLISVVVLKLKDLIKVNQDEAIDQLDIFISECNKDIAHRLRAGKDGAYKILIELLETKFKSYNTERACKDEQAVIILLISLTALMDGQPDLLDYNGIDLIKRLLDGVHNQEILIVTLRLINVCCFKHENNRQNIYSTNIRENFKIILKTEGNSKLLSECLQVIRRLCLDDDVRIEFGKAHEHARELGGHLLEQLTTLLQENTKPPLVSELMLTMATLLVRHELCAKVAECGNTALFTVLADNFDNVAVVQQANKLITALAGNDDVKRQLVKSGIVPVIVSLLARHCSNPTASALTLKCIAALTLREPGHSVQFMENGAAEAIVHCLKVHQNNAKVQKNGCWAIRNIVARCRELNTKFLELGIEAILFKSLELFSSDFGFDIKSALRDLECDVKLDEQWTGKGAELRQ